MREKLNLSENTIERIINVGTLKKYLDILYEGQRRGDIRCYC